MRINGAEIIIRSLERLGIDTITGIPGGSNLPIYDALRRSGIRHILARHEQGAGFIAQGMARSTGRTAVCFATSGPGVMNLLTAIADAKLDSVPIVAITGQVPSSMIGTDAFQEVNTYGMTMNITKHNYMVLSPEELLTVIPEAFSLARSGRPGPVVIDVPKDIQMKEIEIDEWPETAPPRDDTFIDESVLLTIAARLESSRRPVIYAGGGIIHACASHELLCLARKCSIPVALTLMGLGAFPPDDPLYLGMLGMHGARYTNYVLEEADLLLALGVRFDDRAVGNAMEFCPGADIIHIDVDDSEINKIRQSNISIRGDVKTSLSRILPMLHGNSRSEWIYRVNELKGLYGFPRPKTADPFHPLNLIRNIAAAARDDAIITTDVGQHQMWVAQAFPFRHPRTLLTSGGLGTMGFGLPAAIGAALANPGSQVICISGDGSIQMNIQEMATLVDLDLDVKILVINNQHLGLVRQQQELFFNKNYVASRFTRRMDFASIAREYGMRSINLEDRSDPVNALMRMLDEPGPCLIDVPVDYAENVFPMVPPGKANREMIGTA